MAKYDLAISFAGEQRPLARSVAERLDSAGYSVFFDDFHRAALWGKDLTVALRDIYGFEARWCLVLISQDYLRKPWTNLERQNALSRFMKERGRYLLCLRLDDAELPGLPDVVGYQELKDTNLQALHSDLLEILGSPSHDDFITTLDDSDKALAHSILLACYRRAVYTRMDSEINLAAMFASIREATGLVQKLLPQIRNQRLQFAALQIYGALDEIERFGSQADCHLSNHLDRTLGRLIETRKLQIVRLLLEIRRSAAISMQLPLTLATDHFYRLEAASEPPRPET